MELAQICARIEYEGVLLNKEYVMEAYNYERDKITFAKDEFQKDTGRAYKDSSKLFAEIFTERGESFPRTDKGNPSFKGDFLDTCRSATAELINRVRYHEKRANTYFLNFLYYMDENCRIHPSMNQSGTVTGRFSYSNPNLQNIPKEDDEEDMTNPTNVRRAFVPPEGYSILAVDYDQQEYRIMLDYANEKGVISDVMDGKDVHQATADLVGVSRKTAKTLNFMILYGGGVDKLALALGCTRSQAIRIRRDYFRALPMVARLINNIKRRGESRGFIFNRYGRRYWCSDYRFSYKLPNYLIQGTGADVIKHAMVKLDGVLQGQKSKLVLTVHDELLFYLHDDEHDLIPMIKGIMRGVYKPKNGMYLTTSAGISKKSWAYWDLEDL
jgi:DNA polymerase-1